MSSSKQRFLTKLLQVFFKLLYHPLAWTYDWVAWTVSLGQWQEWIQSVIPYLEGPRILELGHGPGHLQISLSRIWKGSTLTFGLDLSPQMGRLASRHMRQHGLTPMLVNGDALRLPYAGETFSRVVATFPTEYILKDDTLSEIWRVLSMGGSLVVLPVALFTGRGWTEQIAAWWFRSTKQDTFWDAQMLETAQEIGFAVHEEWVPLKSNKILIIEAKKNVARN